LTRPKRSFTRSAAQKRTCIWPSPSRHRSDFLAGLYADFHSIRHTFVTNLCKSHFFPKTAQTLARHGDIRLTMEVYTHVDRNEQIDAIRKLKAPEEGAA